MQTSSAQSDNESPSATAAREPEQARRAALYSVLGALLRDAPSREILDYTAAIDAADDSSTNELTLGLSMLALAARHSAREAIRDEYHALFIGLGRGELVPYGSWYQTGFLMEKPLGELRNDLARLGFERAEDTHEPEDHVAALCEVMAMLIHEQAPMDRQREFFNAHMAGWVGDFYRDLAEARSAVFYRSVARLGQAFLDIESRYLSLSD